MCVCVCVCLCVCVCVCVCACAHVCLCIQWNPSCEATPFAPEKWPFKRGGLSSGVKINTFMFRFTLSSGLSRGAASRQGGLSKGVPLLSYFKNHYKMTTITFIG